MSPLEILDTYLANERFAPKTGNEILNVNNIKNLPRDTITFLLTLSAVLYRL